MIQARLIVQSGKHRGKEITLPKGKFLVGRERDCHLRPASEGISRHHCVFTLDEYSVRLRDLGSTNGTLVNGAALRGETVLSDAAAVRIGPLDFKIVIADVAEDVAPPPAEPVDDSKILGDPGSTAGETQFELPQVDENGQPAMPFPPQQPQTVAGYPPQYPGYPPQPGYFPPGYVAPYPGMPYPPGYPQAYPGGMPGEAAMEASAEESDGPNVAALPVKLPPPPGEE
ncbi:MAG: FHA domain-containing protein [Planctomycetota bacterium]